MQKKQMCKQPHLWKQGALKCANLKKKKKNQPPMGKHDAVKCTKVQFRREMCDNPQISGGSNRSQPIPLLGAFLCVFSFLFCSSPRGRSGWRTVPLPHIVNVAKINKSGQNVSESPPPPPPPPSSTTANVQIIVFISSLQYN